MLVDTFKAKIFFLALIPMRRSSGCNDEQEGDGPIYEHATMVTVLSLIMRSNTQMGQI